MHEQLSNTSPMWLQGQGRDEDVVVSSRIRLARNFAAQRFPGMQDQEEAMQVWKHLSDYANDHSGYHFYRLDMVDVLEKQALLANHLISRELAAGSGQYPALVLSDDLAQAVMVNEEDHLRLQAFHRGFDLGEAWQSATALDDAISTYGKYAFNDQLGYLTSCPTNIGTGLRASVMLHLPALVASRQTGILQQVTKLGLTVRGFFGEGSEATGDLFQVSNQVTLGRSEEDILAGLNAATKQLVEAERALREKHYLNNADFTDRAWRALGILLYARKLTSKEAYQLLSMIRLAVSVGVFADKTLAEVDKLFVLAHPGFIQFTLGKEMDGAERDTARAALIRNTIKTS